MTAVSGASGRTHVLPPKFSFQHGRGDRPCAALFHEGLRQGVGKGYLGTRVVGVKVVVRDLSQREQETGPTTRRCFHRSCRPAANNANVVHFGDV